MSAEIFLFLCFSWDVSFLHGVEKEHFDFCFLTQILSGKQFKAWSCLLQPFHTDRKIRTDFSWGTRGTNFSL